jgi:hypothetical protein
MNKNNIVMIAMICHEANRAYCAANGDESQPSWNEAPQSAIDGVMFHFNNPDAEPSHSHENWLATKVAEGWVYGEVKDADKKQHPCMLPYQELPDMQKRKDALLISVVDTFRDLNECPPEYSEIKESKRLRKALDLQLQVIKSAPHQGRERSLARTNLEQSIMWLGMDLKAINTEIVYPNGYNANNEIVDPVADNLKM